MNYINEKDFEGYDIKNLEEKIKLANSRVYQGLVFSDATQIQVTLEDLKNAYIKYIREERAVRDRLDWVLENKFFDGDDIMDEKINALDNWYQKYDALKNRYENLTGTTIKDKDIPNLTYNYSQNLDKTRRDEIAKEKELIIQGLAPYDE